VSEPKAVAVHLEDMDVMREAVEERAGEPLGAEHGRLSTAVGFQASVAE
jgi:hypothetical protein